MMRLLKPAVSNFTTAPAEPQLVCVRNRTIQLLISRIIWHMHIISLDTDITVIKLLHFNYIVYAFNRYCN